MYWNERIAIVDGLRSPFSKSWSDLNGIDPVSLSTHVARELLFSTGVDLAKVDQVVWGTVVSVPRSPNVDREVALNLGLYSTPGFTISRACASGFQSIASAAESLWTGQASVALAGGVDVTSNAPVPHKKDFIDKLRDLPRASTGDKLSTIASLRPSDFFPFRQRYLNVSRVKQWESMPRIWLSTLLSHVKIKRRSRWRVIARPVLRLKTDTLPSNCPNHEWQKGCRQRHRCVL